MPHHPRLLTAFLVGVVVSSAVMVLFATGAEGRWASGVAWLGGWVLGWVPGMIAGVASLWASGWPEPLPDADDDPDD